MFQNAMYALWALLYILCAWLGLIEPDTALQSGAMTTVSVLFFVPPAILLVKALQDGDRKTLRILRYISIASLSLTLAALIANIAVVGASETVGNALYVVLDLLSVPMICSRHYVLSMFLWAVLLFAAIPQKKKK